MGFAGKVQLGVVVRIEGEFVVAFGVAESPEVTAGTARRRGPTFL